MKCPFCEKEIDENERFCPHCDGYLGKAVQTPKKQEEIAGRCSSCYNIIPKGSSVCPSCGRSSFYSLSSTPPTSYYPPPQTNGMAIAGFVLSFLIPILGFIFSIMGINNYKEAKTGIGLSIAGIVISVISMIVNTIINIELLPYLF